MASKSTDTVLNIATRSSVNDNTQTEPVKPPRPIYPTYSWRTRNGKTRLAYIRNHCDANDELSNLARGPLGFDLEWRPNFRKGERENPVAVVQLANEDVVLLLQLSAMSEFPDKLRDILESVNWIKAGVSIQNDCKKLFNDFGVSTRNCVDLGLLARTVDNAQWKGKYTNPIGLSHLLEVYYHFSLPKGKVQRSNWEFVLSDIQQTYAANDGHAGFVLYQHLNGLAQAMENLPSANYYSFSIIRGAVRDISGFETWHAENPFYDPGPPPPPKLPKDPQSTGGNGETAGPSKPKENGRRSYSTTVEGSIGKTPWRGPPRTSQNYRGRGRNTGAPRPYVAPRNHVLAVENTNRSRGSGFQQQHRSWRSRETAASTDTSSLNPHSRL